MKAKHIKLSRGLPKTGQVTVVETGGDGTTQAGWWVGKTSDDNRTRFISKTINGDDIVIDLATGLMWAADCSGAGCNSGVALAWDAAITWAAGLTFAGFSDWRMPNVLELVSIIDFSRSLPCIYVNYFTNTENAQYWSSSYYEIGSQTLIYVHFDRPAILDAGSIMLKEVRVCRGGL